MRVFTFSPRDYFGSNMYIIESDGFGAVIDPSFNYSEIEDFIKNNNIAIKYIILTHAHFDHILELDAYKEHTSAEVVLGREEVPALHDSNINCYKLFFNKDKTYTGTYTTVKDGDLLELGKSQVRIIETPGHTAGSISLFIDGNLFVGDTVFAGNSIGRTDLPGGDIHKLYISIDKISSFPTETVIYSGHGPKTTVKEIKSNFI